MSQTAAAAMIPTASVPPTIQPHRARVSARCCSLFHGSVIITYLPLKYQVHSLRAANVTVPVTAVLTPRKPNSVVRMTARRDNQFPKTGTRDWGMGIRERPSTEVVAFGRGFSHSPVPILKRPNKTRSQAVKGEEQDTMPGKPNIPYSQTFQPSTPRPAHQKIG